MYFTNPICIGENMRLVSIFVLGIFLNGCNENYYNIGCHCNHACSCTSCTCVHNKSGRSKKCSAMCVCGKNIENNKPWKSLVL